jgi:hypothetical protein
MGDAVSAGKLMPKPRLAWDVVDRGSFPGNFSQLPGDELSVVDSETIEEFEGTVFTAVSTASRDLTAFARLRFSGDGSVEVTAYEGDPNLGIGVNATTLESYLNAKGFHYEIREGGSWSPAPAEAMLAIEGLNQAPYIWLIRIIIVALFVAFSIIVHVIWKDRRPAGEGGTA